MLRSCIGMGYYDTYVPAVIQRNVLENPGWYTAYTPYQPEISQGRLEVLLAFQQMVIDLTGMELANASLLDEATAAAEAMTLMQRVNKKSKSKRFLVSEDCHPQTLAVLATRAAPLDIELVTASEHDLLTNDDAFGMLVQYPGSSGQISPLAELCSAAHNRNMLVGLPRICCPHPVNVPRCPVRRCRRGSSQRFVPMGFGGPHAAFFATRDAYKRAIPGRVIGVSVDRRGDPALRMALQTREQHIRREKATSNICTAQALLAIMAALYAMYHGPQGLRKIASRVHQLTNALAHALSKSAFKLCNDSWFDTLTVQVGDQQNAILQAAVEQGFNLRPVADNRIGIALRDHHPGRGGATGDAVRCNGRQWRSTAVFPKPCNRTWTICSTPCLTAITLRQKCCAT